MEISPKRKAMRALSYGVYLVTVKDGDDVSAAIVTWLSQAGMEPTKIMMGLKRDGRIYDQIRNTRKFNVNILGTEQKKMAATFMKKCEISGDSINGFMVSPGENGIPVFDEVPYYLECSVTDWIDQNDHDLILAEITAAGARYEAVPLDLRTAGWKYGG